VILLFSPTRESVGCSFLKRRPLLVVFVLLVGALSGAKVLSTHQSVTVVASIEPLTGLVKEIGGVRVQVETLLPEGVEPHAFQATPQMVETVREADLYVHLGHFSFEEDLAELTGVPAVGPQDYRDMGLQLSPLPGEYGDDHEHSDDMNIHGYWIKPDNCLAIARAVSAQLKLMDAEGEADYTDLLEAFEQEVTALKNNMQRMTIDRDLEGLPVAVTFPAEAYVAELFAMDVVAMLARGDNVFIGAGELSRVEDALREGEIVMIIASEFSRQMAAGEFAVQLSEDTDTPLVFVRTSTLGGLADYSALLTYNLGVMSVEVSSPRTSSETDAPIYLLAIIILGAVVVLETSLLMRRGS
jgi:zinc/manganese transport system substrate-binding protein